ncbi:hypothetical protein V9T40_008817 [Parthenolecanium corni]|uniref:Uncharacterized protein n=1 Tax=Parthenolecanium corni TaxID=536013 RepID=A0AAN9TNT1_9HEMI
MPLPSPPPPLMSPLLPRSLPSPPSPSTPQKNDHTTTYSRKRLHLQDKIDSWLSKKVSVAEEAAALTSEKTTHEREIHRWKVKKLEQEFEYAAARHSLEVEAFYRIYPKPEFSKLLSMCKKLRKQKKIPDEDSVFAPIDSAKYGLDYTRRAGVLLVCYKWMANGGYRYSKLSGKVLFLGRSKVLRRLVKEEVRHIGEKIRCGRQRLEAKLERRSQIQQKR